jgi:polysaccharide chain length determinant protein (PEP-CTERM system associated)
MVSFPVQIILDILRRRMWIAIAVVAVAASAAAGLALFLPNTYTSSAVIVVEGQQIPEAMVRPTVTTGSDTRLQRISQEILSRSRLERIIREFNLYPDLQKTNIIDDVIAAMRRDIGLESITGRRRPASRQQQEAVSFAVGYTGPDARKVMLVANTLASFFIEENLKVRERQASGTTDFLQVQLQETRKRLEQQETQVAEFKERNMGELPQQVDANLKTLDRLQAQRKDVMDGLVRARERRAQMVRQLNEGEPRVVDGVDLPIAARPDPLAARIAGLQRQLADMRMRFSDKYPDVVQLKVEIARLEDEQRKAAEKPPEKPTTSTARSTPVAAPRPESALVPLDLEIKRGAEDLDRLQREIDKYQRRVENAPRREQELIALTRDYNSTRDLYASLLKRQEEASIAESMEQRQKGEQFRILDPAVMPDSPTGPPRLFVFLVGILLGLGLAAGVIVLIEALDGSFHNVEDLKSFARLPVLVAIPRIVTDMDLSKGRMGRLIRAGVLAVSLVVVFGASYVIAKDNEQLVRTVTRAAVLKK